MKLPGDLSVFQALNARLNMLETRQSTVAENVANANTPRFVPKDVDMASFDKAIGQFSSPSVGRTNLAVTQSGHIPGKPVSTPNFSTVSVPDSEVTMDGNAVVVEEQMLRLNQVKTDFDTALGLYQKGLSMIRLAAKAPQ
ncbi:MAG: flagellar biosynthesis protein FlgB [Ponticaulis sp.]|nr:flagellar biosynthesis protein FlgB [Ponticaulis sp.]